MTGTLNRSNSDWLFVIWTEFKPHSGHIIFCLKCFSMWQAVQIRMLDEIWQFVTTHQAANCL